MTHPSGLVQVSDAPRIDAFVRPRRPDDHREFEWLLPQCTPLYVWADDRGDEYIRWSVPRPVVEQLGWGAMKCDCCETRSQQTAEHAVQIDTAWWEVDWFFEGLDVTGTGPVRER